MKNKIIRLSKIISHAGICSRREAEKLIANGEVKVNGEIYKEYSINNSEIQTISVSEKELTKKKKSGVDI